MLAVLRSCVKTEKSEEGKKIISAHSSIVKANLHRLVRKKYKSTAISEQIYKETKTNMKTRKNCGESGYE